MRILTLVVFHTLALLMCTSTALAEPDWGGSVIERRLEIGELIFTDEVIRRPEVCASACTMYLVLGRDRVCTLPTTPWGFHSASHPVTGEIGQRATEIMVGMYPPPLQTWFWMFAHGKTGDEMTWVPGLAIIANGWAHECP